MYLSYIKIENYKGIQCIETNFNSNINIIIGENGSCKSALIDAIRILYNVGEPIREISVSSDDFNEKEVQSDSGPTISKSTLITITYIFKGLSIEQKGAFYEYMAIDPGNSENEYAKVTISYEYREDKYPQFSYNTGDIDGQKADYKTFELFQHYYLGALRDSTRDLLSNRSSILGKVIRRYVRRDETEPEIEQIMKNANTQLLDRPEVEKTRDGVNNNLNGIFKKFLDNKIGLRIEDSKTDYIVNVIKPFLPHNRNTLSEEGFHLWQNSLGLNNLIYIAVVLGDVKEQIEDNRIPHYALLIEEPEAHLHPQLQLSLYNFLTEANTSDNSQLFITTHSPTLTSKVPFKNLILLSDNKAYQLNEFFKNRSKEKLVENTKNNYILTDNDLIHRQKKLERYIDVTRSQLLYAKSILFVEGISEELLISAFTKINNYQLEDYRIELVNVKGTSFYPFLYLFNHQDKNKRIQKNITVLTDDDRFPSSKKSEYSFNKLISDPSKLDELDNKIQKGFPNTRIANLTSVANSADNIKISHSFKTLEYELALANVFENRTDLNKNFLFEYLLNCNSKKASEILDFAKSFANDKMTSEEQRKIGILLWKALPSKASFAQDFSIHIIENIEDAKKSFRIPDYILDGLNHLTGGV